MRPVASDAATGGHDRAPTPDAKATRLATEASETLRGGNLVASEVLSQRALELRLGVAAESLEIAQSLHDLGLVATRREALARAEGLFHRALAIKQRRAGDGVTVAATVNGLGIVAASSGRLEAASALFGRAASLWERVEPGGLNHAAALNNLGNVAWTRGDLVRAEDLYRRALELRQRLAPDSLAIASSLNNLSLVVAARGDLAGAEELQRRSFAIRERLAPASTETASSLNNMGEIARERGDLAAAAELFQRSLAVRERIAPGSVGVASGLENLGNVAREQGDLVTAEELLRRSLEIRERLAPESLEVAASLSNLGNVVRDRGDLDTAEALYRRALGIKQRLAPESLAVARTLTNLSTAAQDRGDLDRAESLERDALRLFERLAPGLLEHALAEYSLGTILRDQGRLDEALGHMAAGVDALEVQHERLGGSGEVRAGFRAQHIELYRDFIDLLLKAGREDQAFHVLERSRARQLLELLAERDLVFAADISTELDRERRMLAVESDRVVARLGELAGAGRGAESEEALAELVGIRRRQAEVREQVRAACPRLAALRYPQPLDLDEARAALDPGVLLLAWTLGAERSYLLAVGPDQEGLEVVPLGFGADEIRDKVGRLRTQIEGSSPRMAGLGQELGDALLGPVAGRIERSERLLLVPDGPLHGLPFAALRGFGVEPRWLVEAQPLTVVSSATVFAELKRQRRQRERITVAAFGDPIYPARPGQQASLGPQGRLRSALGLEPLPATRREVEELARLFPGSISLYLGPEATEARVKSLGRDVAIVHIASHGLIDERLPLDSALALSPPETGAEAGDNGLLQAWEVLEQVRLDADLVTLSACETGLGQELEGEGIIGLTRAFQYAGARSVLTSLWSVADESTAELMRRFYAKLRSGQPKDEALRRAQLDLVETSVEIDVGERRGGRDFSQPLYWAGFQLVGDWR